MRLAGRTLSYSLFSRAQNELELRFTDRYSDTVMPINPMLLSAIRAFPDEDEPREQLAAWYSNQADVRGRFIRLQLEIARTMASGASLLMSLSPEEREALEAKKTEADGLLSEHGRDWLTEWGLAAADVVWSRGLPEIVRFSWAEIESIDQTDIEYAPVLCVRAWGPNPLVSRLLSWVSRFGLPHLDLACNTLSIDDIHILCNEYPLHQVYHLNLSHCEIRDAGATMLAQSPTLSSLRSLNLGQNKLTATAIETLVKSDKLQSIQKLSLWNNPIGDNGLRALTRQDSLNSISELDIAKTELSDIGFSLLCSSSVFQSLHTLIAAENAIGQNGCEALAHADLLKGLNRLDLSYNPLGDAGGQALGKLSSQNQLRSLLLRNCSVGSEGVKPIAESGSLQHLQHLDLSVYRSSSNLLGDPGAVALAKGGGLPELREMLLARNGIGDKGARPFVKSNNLHHLMTLDLTGNKIANNILERIQQSPTLPSLCHLLFDAPSTQRRRTHLLRRTRRHKRVVNAAIYAYARKHT